MKGLPNPSEKLSLRIFGSLAGVRFHFAISEQGKGSKDAWNSEVVVNQGGYADEGRGRGNPVVTLQLYITLEAEG